MSEQVNINDVIAGWKQIGARDARNLPMNIGPASFKICEQSKRKLAKISLQNSDPAYFKEQYAKIKKQLKIACRRRLIYNKFAVLGILIVIGFAGLRYHEANRQFKRSQQLTVEQIDKMQESEKNGQKSIIEKYTYEISLGKEGLKAGRSSFKSDPEALEKYWKMIHYFLEKTEKESARLGKISVNEFYREVKQNATREYRDKLIKLIGMICVLPVYLISRLTPNYLLWKQRYHGNALQKGFNILEYIVTGSFLMSLAGGIMGSAGDNDYIVKTTWSDGSVTYDAPDTGGFFKFILAIILLSIIITLLPARIILGFLRN